MQFIITTTLNRSVSRNSSDKLPFNMLSDLFLVVFSIYRFSFVQRFYKSLRVPVVAPL
jgi:hypothetical protein